MTSPIEDAIFQLLTPLPSGKSIGPEEAAKLVDPQGWRRSLGQVRAVAIGLARMGKLVILRHNKPADPNAFKGVYRLRLPMEGDPPVMAVAALDISDEACPMGDTL